MEREVKYLLILLILFVSCERIYHPSIDRTEGDLVVDARITNDPAKSFVHLTKTRSFYDQVPLPEVSGARVELLLIGSKTSYVAVEKNTGYYSFNVTPTIGKSYYLRITIGSDIYESLAATMPPQPTMDDFYTIDKVSKVFITNGDGVPQAFEKQGREIDADLPLSDSLSHYRFDVRSIIEWVWDSIPTSFSRFPNAYGWYSYNENQKFNLAGPTDFNQVSKIKNHPLLMISYNALDYLYTDTLTSKGWILIIGQYGTSKESYEFHQKLNSQFAATGSLFDPIQTQVVGNVLCKNDPTKIVYGFFELNSYQEYRYYFELFSPTSEPILKRVYRFPDIPDHGIVRSIQKEPPIRPDWWEE